MRKRRTSKRPQRRGSHHLIYTLLALVIGLSLNSCADIPAKSVAEARIGLEQFTKELSAALREIGAHSPKTAPSTSAGQHDFLDCPQFFANAKPPAVASRPTDRALCYDAFAILHSGESKTAVFVAEKLNRASIADADEKRTNKFFADARLRSAERASLADYKNSGFDRGHLAPAGDIPAAQAMAQSFSLANMIPQAPKHNRGVSAKSVEAATRKYAARATGNVYVITDPV